MATIPENVLAEVGQELAALSGAPAGAESDADTPVGDNLGALLKRYTELENERRKHADRTDELAAIIKPLEEALLEAFAEAGLQNARANGLTVFIRTDRFVSKKGEFSTEAICEKLKELGCAYMVKEGYSASSLKAKVTEWQNEGVTVPADLAAMLNIGEIARITSRK